MNSKSFSKEIALNTYRRVVDSEKGLTLAQVFYNKLVQKAFDENTIAGKENNKKLAHALSEREAVKIKNDLIKQEADKYFKLIGNPQLTEILFEELERQQNNTQERLKKEAVAKGIVLYHATPLAKEELKGEVLKGTTERPDLAWEKTFIGVCMFSNSNGAYALKKPQEENDFSCKGENLVILTDDRLVGKKNDEVLGYIHGHKITENDDFTPTVSLGGDITGEWTTPKEVSIDISKEVTLNTLRENGVYVFSTNKDDKNFIKYLSNKLELNHEEQIKLLTDMAANPYKKYIDKDNNPRNVAVKNELYPDKNFGNLNILSRYSSENAR